MLQLYTPRDFPTVFGAGSDVNQYLTDGERAHLATLKVEKRRREWLLGRMGAKSIIQRYLALRHGITAGWTDIGILPDEDSAPTVTIAQEAAPKVTISLSHRSGFAVLAVGEQTSGWSLGVDVERVEPRIQSFVADYFTDRERQHLGVGNALERDRLVTVYWCVKEAVLKAVRKGLSVSADRVEVLELSADGTVTVSLDRELSTGTVHARCWHLPSHVVTWAAVDTVGAVITPPTAPYPARHWLPEEAMASGLYPIQASPKLSLVGS